MVEETITAGAEKEKLQKTLHILIAIGFGFVAGMIVAGIVLL